MSDEFLNFEDLFKTDSPTEHPADLRTFGTAVFQIFQVLVQSGFTEDQAMKLTATVLQTQLKGPA